MFSRKLTKSSLLQLAGIRLVGLAGRAYCRWRRCPGPHARGSLEATRKAAFSRGCRVSACALE
jgi:hypothetical protein